MKSLIKKMKFNNKGNTLAIVLIGMLIVGVLGTVILNASSVNVGMKITNLKGKQNFYYVERAIDEIYIGIGQEVSKAMQDAYDDVIKNVVKNDGSGYAVSTSLDTQFRDKYLEKFTSGAHHTSVYSQIGTAVSHLKDFINNSDFDFSNAGVKIDVEECIDAAGVSTSNIVPVLNGSGDIESITIQNVLVKSTSLRGTSKYESFVKTDFVIKVPEVSFSFNDSSSSDGLKEFFKYAIIANGEMSGKPQPDQDTDEGAVYIKSGSSVVNGNIYAGSYYGWAEKDGQVNRQQYFDKDSIYVGGNASLVVNGADIIANGAVNLDTGATIQLNGEDKMLPADKKIATNLPLRLWANDILLTGNGATANISGDCFIKDDLEINGSQGIVDISGSYYGFGYSEDGSDMTKEADSTEALVLSDQKIPGRNDNYHADLGTSEHEKRSAVIVNGNGAAVRLASGGSDPRQLVLGGRAYIDLSGNLGQTKTADYMTGESISIKGNQKIYLIDNPASFQTPDEHTVSIPGNPASVSDLQVGSISTMSDFYDWLKLDRNQIIPKRVGDMVYFYHREVDPDQQTQYVVDSVRDTTKDYWQNINYAVSNMDVRELSIGAGTSTYTVGTAMQVDGVNHKFTTGAGEELAYGGNGISEADFIDIITDIRTRYANMMYWVNDTNDENHSGREYRVGDLANSKNNQNISVPGMSPYDYYVDKGMLINNPEIGARKAIQIRPINGSKKEENFPITGSDVYGITTEELKNKAHIEESATIILEFGNNKEAGPIKIEGNSGKSYGVIVCTGSVEVDRDFEGMIICGGDIIMDKNSTFTANPDLMKLLCEKSKFLSDLIGGKMTTTISPPAGDTSIVDGDKFDFTSLVEIKNWRKNED